VSEISEQPQPSTQNQAEENPSALLAKMAAPIKVEAVLAETAAESAQPKLRLGWPLLTATLGLVIFVLIMGLSYVILPTKSSPLPHNEAILFVTVTPTLPPSAPRLGDEAPLSMTLITPTVQAKPAATFAGANEMGKVLVLMYHRITYPEARYQRTPENLRADLQRLYDEGYYPVNFIDLLHGLPDVPGGKKPVVITFDDSDITQFQVLADNTIDADSAVGIILNFHQAHPTDWPTKATFFILGDDRNNYYKIFGQSEFAQAKLKVLADLGMEIAGHTVSHADLSVTTAERIYWELAVSKHVLEELVPGYTVQTMAVPFGGFPYTVDFLKSGQWGAYQYSYVGNAAAWGGPSPSPFAADFDSYRVPRMEVMDDFFSYWLDYYQAHPNEYYISDGDPTRLTYPQPLANANQ